MKHEFFIAGVKFHDLHKIINNLNPGDNLDLIAEPDNKYDPNAVQLISNGTMCGYVPKTLSAEISAVLTLGPVYCRIISVDPSAKSYLQCKVEVNCIDYDKDETTEEEF